MPDIFSYSDYRKFLKDYYTESKQKSSAFSFRYFARKAELPSFNYLKLVMDGKRSLTPEYLKKFVKGLKLSEREAHYFETMVSLNQSKDASLQSEYLRKLFEIKRRVSAREILRDQEKVYSEWYHWVIREMVLLPDFKDDPKWISQKLNHAITPAHARESLKILKRLGLLTRKNSKWMPSYRAVKTSDEVSNIAIKKLHEAFIQKALECLFNTPLEEREFSGLTIALPKSKIPCIKEKIKYFRKELNEILSAEENLEEVYQLNIQFYPLTRRLK